MKFIPGHFSKMYSLLILTGILLLSCNNESQNKKTEESGKMVIQTDNINLSEQQRARKAVYQMLASEMINDIEEKNDTATIDCGTRLTLSEYDKIAEVFADVCKPELMPDDTTRIIDFPLFIHVVSGSLQQTTIEKGPINQAIGILNNKYRDAKINFSIRGYDTIISPMFVNFKEDDQPFLLNQYKKNKFINVFIFNSITSSSGAKLNGYTTFSRGDDFIMMTGNALQNGTTFSHEMGHFFVLYHTHGKTNSGTTDELVNSPSCSCTGDDVCDTPADPNLFGIIKNDCVYKGTVVDANGDIYKPDTKNLMSYAHLCRSNFSKGQYNRMRWAALKYRNYF